MEFFRHCPGCGRRFHIRLQNKKMIHLKRKTYQRTKTGPMGTSPSAVRPSTYAVVFTGAPVTLDIEDFDYTYKCGHCDHQWTEHHEKIRKEG